MALLAAQKELGDVVTIDISEGVPRVKARYYAWCNRHALIGALIGSNDYAAMKDADVVIVTAGLPRKPV